VLRRDIWRDRSSREKCGSIPSVTSNKADTAADEKIQDRLFDYVLSRVRTRESSTLVIATVATSVSLVLFAVPLTNTQALDPTVFRFMGIIFPLLGFAYREATILTIDQADFDDIHRMLNDTHLRLKAQSSTIKAFGQVRGIIFRTFLLIPVVAWSCEALGCSLHAEIGAFVVSIAVAYALNRLEWYIREICKI